MIILIQTTINNTPDNDNSYNTNTNNKNKTKIITRITEQ